MSTTEGTLLQCDKTLESTSNMELGYTFSWLNRWNAHLKEYPVKLHILTHLYTSYEIPNKYTLLSLIYKFFVKNLNNLFSFIAELFTNEYIFDEKSSVATVDILDIR